MKNKDYSFYILVVAIFLGIISPYFLSIGMFMDGLLYADISKNLARGIGSFWDLKLTETFNSHFNGHPPLAFGLQSLFFKILGDSIYTEKIYSILTYFITGFIIVAIWKRISTKEFKKFAWLPLFLWICIPIVTWAAPNNMLENTMMIFTSLSVLFYIKSLQKNSFLYLSLAGFMLFLGFMSKGLVALFPLLFGFWLWVFKRNTNFQRFLTDFIILLSAILLPFLFMYMFVPQGIEYIAEYFNKQIIGSIENSQTVNNRFFILGRMIMELLPVGIIVVLISLFTRKCKPKNHNINWFLIFVFLGLSGVLPIIVSMKQRGFYILATFPFFSIAFAYIIAPKLNYIFEKVNKKVLSFDFLKYISFLFLAIAITLNIMQINKIGRNKELLSDIYHIIEIVPESSIISVSDDIWSNWSLHGYLYRLANISIESKTPFENKFLLVNKKNNADTLIIYKKYPIILDNFELYEKK